MRTNISFLCDFGETSAAVVHRLTRLHCGSSKDYVCVQERQMHLHLLNIWLECVSNLLQRWIFKNLQCRPLKPHELNSCSWFWKQTRCRPQDMNSPLSQEEYPTMTHTLQPCVCVRVCVRATGLLVDVNVNTELETWCVLMWGLPPPGLLLQRTLCS